MLAAQAAWGAPDLSGTVIIDEPNGSFNLCDAPCYRVEKAVEVFLNGNPTGPGVCAAGENTYLYTLTHIGGNPTTFPGNPILPILRFEVEVDATTVGSAGFIPGVGIPPSSTFINTIEDVVTWTFLTEPLVVPKSSEQLFICSALTPGNVADTVVSLSGPLALDAPGTCVGPILPPLCQLEIDKTCCLPSTPLPGTDICEGKVERVVFEYTGES